MTKQGDSVSGSTVRKQIFADQISVNFMPVGNRDIDYRKVAKIKLSMQMYGITSGITLIKTDVFDSTMRYYAADGQHRYEAARALNMLDRLPIFIVQKEFRSIPEIIQFVATLNTTQKSWTLVNFVEAYCSVGAEEYIFLRNICNTYNISYPIGMLLCGWSGNGLGYNSFKDGHFKVRDMEKTRKVFSYIQDCFGVLEICDSRPMSYFAEQFYRWYNDSTYDHAKFLKFLKRNKLAFKLLKRDGIYAKLQECKL